MYVGSALFAGFPEGMNRSTKRFSLYAKGENGGGRTQSPLEIEGFRRPRLARVRAVAAEMLRASLGRLVGLLEVWKVAE